MQYAHAHLVAHTEHASVLQIHNDDCKIAEDPFERAIAPTIKEPKRNHTVRHQWQVVRCYVEGIAQLKPIVDAAIEQHDETIGEDKRLLLKAIFRCQLVQTKHKGCIAAHQGLLPIRPVWL